MYTRLSRSIIFIVMLSGLFTNAVANGLPDFTDLVEKNNKAV